MANLVIPTDIPSKANPVDNDILIVCDSADNNELKQITIGSITADIGDGLIVDGSESATTTYSSEKINDLNDAQDTTISSNYTTLNTAKANRAGDTFTGQVKLAKGVDLASASTVDLGAATGNFVHITGTITITSFGTTTAGTTVKVRFAGALLLTYNATSLILPTLGNITTAANDTATFVSEGSGNWRCTEYTRADGSSVGAVVITSLTEDTVGDMDADFALVYDNSAGQNRKQKVNVFRATAAEIVARTSTTKFVTPAQLDQFSVSTNLRNDWWTLQVGETTWTTSTYTSTAWNAGGYWTFTGNTTGVSSTSLPGNGSTANYGPALNKDIRLKWRLKSSTFNAVQGFGFCITPANIFTNESDISNGLVRFVTRANALYAHNSDGSTATSTNVTGSITFTDYNTYEIIFNPGTDIKYYINGTLVATHTTNLPTTGTLVLAHGVATSTTLNMFPPILSFEI